MKLFYFPTSPFVRKVVVTAKELGVADRIELATVTVSPIAPSDDLNAENPLGKIPCLITDDGDAIYDSRVICDYLDQLDGTHLLIPASGPERWRNLRIMALCDGIQEAVILTLYEGRVRPEELHYQPWIDAQMAKVKRGIVALAKEMAGADQSLDMAAIAAGVALGYLNFRLPDIGWQQDHPEMAVWYAEFEQRPSMQETIPADP